MLLACACQYRGTLTKPGKNSPFRERSVEENLEMLRKMKAGDYDEGSHVLRAKVTSLEFRVQGIVCIAKFALLCCAALRG